MEKLKRVWGNQRGDSSVYVILIVLLLFLLSTSIYEFMRLHITAVGVRDAFQDAVIAVSNENFDPTYRGTRQGYSGGYLRDGVAWV